jgi:hypothetical protein
MMKKSSSEYSFKSQLLLLKDSMILISGTEADVEGFMEMVKISLFQNTLMGYRIEKYHPVLKHDSVKACVVLYDSKFDKDDLIQRINEIKEKYPDAFIVYQNTKRSRTDWIDPLMDLLNHVDKK